MLPSISRLALIVAATGLLGACSTVDRLANVGNAPPLSPIDGQEARNFAVPVSLPMPSAETEVPQANSLWQTGARSFFKDQRAQTVGDILTVMIEIDDSASINNRSVRSRDNSESAGLPNFLGLESNLENVLPDAVTPDSLIDLESASSSTGTGTITRGEQIELMVAAIVTQVLPNGNLMIHGRQEVRVNYEVRELQIAGIIRPSDIRSNNTVSYEQIAEARISYGGRGHISDVQQPRLGQQIYDIVFPF